MSHARAAFVCLIALFAVGVVSLQAQEQIPLKVTSPNGQIALLLWEAAETSPATTANQPAPLSSGLRYAVEFHGKRLIEESPLGLELAPPPASEKKKKGAPAETADQLTLGLGMHRVATRNDTVDETYSIPVGKTATVHNHCTAVHAEFKDGQGRELWIEGRVFDDGIAFRYVIPEQANLKQVKIAHELTQFTYAKDATTYPLLLNGFQTPYEDEYVQRQVSGLHPDWLIGLPYLADEPGLGWVAITEANIDNYAGMYVQKTPKVAFGVHAELSPRIDEQGVAVDATTPVTSPWRVLMIGDEPGRLIESNIVLNLNPPTRIADPSWIKAGKSAWDWWSGEAAPGVDFKTGMNTATMKHYIDFASASGFPYMLIDAGWAAAPTGGKIGENVSMADITKVNPDVDMPGLLSYANDKHVKLWLWSHWTSVDKYMDQAFPLFEKWGIAGVKIDFMNREDQQMVAFYHRVVENAAAHHLMIDFHGAYKPDGLRRTWPNLITREGVMGKEYLKWSARTTPLHDTTLPFTRMLAGPMDYTPGAFGNSTRENFIPRQVEPMGLGTRAHELALYAVFESPFEMVSDYPEHYQGQPEFDFIKRVPATWDEVKVVSGKPMETITVARRSGKDWYVGSLTNWNERDISISFSFLGDGDYTAEMYSDAQDAATEPTHTSFSKLGVTKDSVLEVHMAPGGGNAIWIHPGS
ncbi:MAG: glycoside hydrolase family 97 protein [Terracidiphilus sp.]